MSIGADSPPCLRTKISSSWRLLAGSRHRRPVAASLTWSTIKRTGKLHVLAAIVYSGLTLSLVAVSSLSLSSMDVFAKDGANGEWFEFEFTSSWLIVVVLDSRLAAEFRRLRQTVRSSCCRSILPVW